MKVKRKSRKSASIDKVNVLLVNHDEAAIVGISKVIKNEMPDLVIHCASSGVEAMSILKLKKFNVVIAGLYMPEMSGIEFLRNIKDLGIQTNVIMVTAHGSLESYLECTNLGAVSYIHKPVKPSELMEAISKTLSGP